MNWRRILALTGIAMIAILLAFPLRETVYRTVIVPLAYVFWVLGLWYHAVNQSVWWGAALFFVLVILARSLRPAGKVVERIRLKPRPALGQVEDLAIWMKRTERGIYFKWLIANRLGRIAHEILLQRQGGKPRSFFDPLTGPDWEPEDSVRQYLEAGLGGSFAEYPQKRRFFSKPVPTPLDYDVHAVVEFLEKQINSRPAAHDL